MSIGRITDKGYATNAFLWENMSAICLFVSNFTAIKVYFLVQRTGKLSGLFMKLN
jgi:hypothetical protein